MAIGPTGEFKAGKPINEHDKGGLFASMKPIRLAGSRQAIEMNFGTVIDWVAIPPEHAVILAQRFRERVEDWYGSLAYDASTLPIKVSGNSEKHVVECKFPASMEVLIANPEVFLAWADRLVETALELSEANRTK